MQHKRNRLGFTIVELLVVIVVIGILATITMVSYGGVQDRAKDATMRDAARKLADSIQLWSSANPGVDPQVGGSGSRGPATAAGCDSTSVGAADGWGAPGVTGHACTWGDVLIAGKYLPSNFFTSLPPNTVQTIGAPETNLNFYVIKNCDQEMYVTYSLKRPTTADTASMDKLRTGACSSYAWTYTQGGMRAAIKFDMSN